MSRFCLHKSYIHDISISKYLKQLMQISGCCTVTLGLMQRLPTTKNSFCMTFLGVCSLLCLHLICHLLIFSPNSSSFSHFFFISKFKKSTSASSFCSFHAISSLIKTMGICKPGLIKGLKS